AYMHSPWCIFIILIVEFLKYFLIFNYYMLQNLHFYCIMQFVKVQRINHERNNRY
ncbi:hypothetical protein cco94_08047, partial [Campylobacter coli H9]